MSWEDALDKVRCLNDEYWAAAATLKEVDVGLKVAEAFEAALALLGDPDAGSWAAAQAAAAAPEAFYEELADLGVFGASHASLRRARRLLASIGPLEDLLEAVEPAAPPPAPEPKAAPSAGRAARRSPAGARAKAQPPPPPRPRPRPRPGSEAAFALAVLVEAALAARESGERPRLPQAEEGDGGGDAVFAERCRRCEWPRVQFKELHSHWQAALMNGRKTTVLVCEPDRWQYAAVLACLQRRGCEVVDMTQLQLRFSLAKTLTLAQARAELAVVVRQAAVEGRRVVLNFHDVLHSAHHWVDEAEGLPRGLFGGGADVQMPGVDEVHDDFQLFILVEMPLWRAKEQLPSALPEFAAALTLCIDTTSLPSPARLEEVARSQSSQAPGLRSAMRLMSLPSSASQVSGLFRQYDLDRNGSLSAEELASLLQRLQPDFSLAMIDRIVREVAPGEDGTISFEDFVLWTMRAGTESPPPPPVLQRDISVDRDLAEAVGDEAPEQPTSPSAVPAQDIIINAEEFEYIESFGEDWESRWNLGPVTTGPEGQTVRTDLIRFRHTERPVNAPPNKRKPCLELKGGADRTWCTGMWTSFEPLIRPTEVEFYFIVDGKVDVQNAVFVFTETPIEGGSLLQCRPGVYFACRLGMQLVGNGMHHIGAGRLTNDTWNRVQLRIDWDAKEIISQVDGGRLHGLKSPRVSPFCDTTCRGFGYLYIFNMDVYAVTWLHSLRVKQGTFVPIDAAARKRVLERAYFSERAGRNTRPDGEVEAGADEDEESDEEGNFAANVEE